MSRINVEPAGGRDFDVEVAEETTAGTRGRTFTFHVTVDQPVLAAMGLASEDSAMLAALVRESFVSCWQGSRRVRSRGGSTSR